MFPRGAVLLLCVLVSASISEGARMPNCRKFPSGICPMNYVPVCGSDGVTYGNECSLCAAARASHASIFIQRPGPCKN